MIAHSAHSRKSLTTIRFANKLHRWRWGILTGYTMAVVAVALAIFWPHFFHHVLPYSLRLFWWLIYKLESGFFGLFAYDNREWAGTINTLGSCLFLASLCPLLIHGMGSKAPLRRRASPALWIAAGFVLSLPVVSILATASEATYLLLWRDWWPWPFSFWGWICYGQEPGFIGGVFSGFTVASKPWRPAALATAVSALSILVLRRGWRHGPAFGHILSLAVLTAVLSTAALIFAVIVHIPTANVFGGHHVVRGSYTGLVLAVTGLFWTCGAAIILLFAWPRWAGAEPVPECRTCGYNLSGNVRCICPECGTAIPPDVMRVLGQTVPETDRAAYIAWM